MQFITISYLVLCSACLWLVIRGLKLTLDKSELSQEKQRKIRIRVTSGIFFWLALVSILSYKGFFIDFSMLPPRITLTLIPPMIFWLIFTVRSKNLKSLLQNIPGQWLIYIQSFRVAVELILWKQLLEGVTPIQMTFEGRNFDVLVGLTAPFIAYLYSRNSKKFRKLAIAWNFFGLAMLMNILIIAILSFPTKFRYFMNEPANTLVADFPVILLPAFLVMIAYVMHFFSLKQLLIKSSNY